MKQSQYRRSGLTLTELLVVIAIIVIVTAVLAPVLTSSLEGREVREAARQINAYMQQAQARAKELNRPVGVMIRRTPALPGQPLDREQDLDFGFQLSLAEVPPPYAGFTPSSRAFVQLLDTTGVPTGSVRIFQDPAFFRLVVVNDFIRFNYRGPKYRILRLDPSSSSILIDLAEAETKLFAPATKRGTLKFSAPLKFEVFRRPKSISSTPLELPTGAGVVLSLSGAGVSIPNAANADGEESSLSTPLPARQKYIGLTEFQRPQRDIPPRYLEEVQNQPLTILFSPTGEVEWVYRVLATKGTEANQFWSRYPPKRPQDKLYLFVGKQGVTRWQNLDDGSNLWITIDPQTGLVTTAPNSIPLDSVAQRSTLVDRLRGVAESRQLAATGQSMGGL